MNILNNNLSTFPSDFNEFINHVGIGILILNKKMDIQYINIKAVKIFGYNNGELEKIFSKL